MQQQTLKRLADMLAAADAVARFTAGKSMADFLADELLRSGAYYQFSILGAALSQVRKSEPDAEQVTEYARIIGFRNQVIHGYDRIDDEITWRVVEQKLAVLQADVRRLLGI